MEITANNITYIQAHDTLVAMLCCSPPLVPASTYKRVLKPQEKVCRETWDGAIACRPAFARIKFSYGELLDRPVLMRGAHLRMIESYKYSYLPRNFCTELLRRYMRRYRISAFNRADWEVLRDRWNRFRKKYEGDVLDKRSVYPGLFDLIFKDKKANRSGRNITINGLGKVSHCGTPVDLGRITTDSVWGTRTIATLGRLNKLALEYLEMETEYKTPLDKIDVIIESPADLRRQLLDTISGVLSGQIACAQANAVVGLSAEVHKSIKQQWDMQLYATEHLELYANKRLEGGI